MAQHRYRHNKIKREHTIIEGILPILEAIAQHPGVHGITPGRISQRSSSSNTGVTFQYKTDAGLKLIARTTTAVQEVFLVTDHPDQVLNDLIARRLVKARVPDRTNAGHPAPGLPPGLREADPKRGQADAAQSRDANSKRPSRSKGRREKEPGSGGPEAPASQAQETQAGREEPSSRGPAPARRPEVADAISAEVQEQLLAMARERAGARAPARQSSPKKRTNLWREIERTHRELLRLEEPRGRLD